MSSKSSYCTICDLLERVPSGIPTFNLKDVEKKDYFKNKGNCKIDVKKLITTSGDQYFAKLIHPL